MNKLLYAIFLILSINIATVSGSQQVNVNHTIDLGNGNISFSNQENFTLMDLTGNNLELFDGGNNIVFSVGDDKNISNISFNPSTDSWSFEVNGTSGYIAIVATQSNRNSLYSLSIDGVKTTDLTSSSFRTVNYNYTGPWSNHVFVIHLTSIGTQTTSNLTLALISLVGILLSLFALLSIFGKNPLWNTILLIFAVVAIIMILVLFMVI